MIHSWGGCQGLCFLRYSTADFKVCLGSLSCCRSHPLSYYSIYTDGLMFACRICWYFIESILLSTTEMFPVPLAETQAKSMIDLSPCLAVATVVHFFMKSCTKQLCLLQPQNDFFFFAFSCLAVYLQISKADFSDNDAWKFIFPTWHFHKAHILIAVLSGGEFSELILTLRFLFTAIS